MAEGLRIGAVRPQLAGFNVGRDEGGLFAFVRQQNVGRFVVGHDRDGLSIDALPLRPRVWGTVYWDGTPWGPAPLVDGEVLDSCELECFLAYPGANFGHWNANIYVLLAPRWGYPFEIRLNDYWRSLGRQTATREQLARWALPDDAVFTSPTGGTGYWYNFILAAPTLRPSNDDPALYATPGLTAYHPFTAGRTGGGRGCDLTRNYVTYFTGYNPPALKMPSNWPVWPPTP